MKKNIVKILVLFFSLTVGMGSSLSAQNYFSKPESIKNLSDAAKYLSSTLDQLEENNEAQYKINSEKLRFIKIILKELKKSNSVQEVAEKHLPKEESNVIQPAVRFIDTSFANVTPQKYIRTEILFLISY
ncbi:MAG: hypothetical protein P1U56_16485 [Saprospiraceae bacterium]|nr:hypothetical protein [Saprospiraceae bacterium]